MDVINFLRSQFDGYVQWILRGRPSWLEDFINGVIRENSETLIILVLYLVFVGIVLWLVD